MLLGKTGICPKNWTIWWALTNIELTIFFDVNFAHVYNLPISTKGCSEVFNFILILNYLKKIKKIWFIHHHSTETTFFFFFYISINNSRYKQDKKYPTPFSKHRLVGNVCRITAKNIKFSGSWSSSESLIAHTNNLVSWEIKSFVNIQVSDFL